MRDFRILNPYPKKPRGKMKRTAEKEKEQKETKKPTRKLVKDRFKAIEDTKLKHVRIAIQHAFKSEGFTGQPIIFQLTSEDSPGNNDCQIAYWPASEEIGEWLLKTLISYRDDPNLSADVHQAMMERIIVFGEEEDDWNMDAFEDFYEDKIKKLSYLGRFKKVIPLDEWNDIYDGDIEDYVIRENLDTFLYHEQCYFG